MMTLSQNVRAASIVVTPVTARSADSRSAATYGVMVVLRWASRADLAPDSIRTEGRTYGSAGLMMLG
jgi:hypothetical protein